MSKIYRNTKTGIVAVSGNVKGLSEDKKAVIITTTQRDTDGKYNPVDFTAELTEPANEADYPVGAPITAYGYQSGANSIRAEMCSTQNSYGQCSEKLAIVAGDVLFATYRPEVDENGQPKLNQAGAPRKPHFDITVAVGTGRDRVNHIVKVYNFTNKETGKVTDNIGTMQKRFEKFDYKENPMYVSIATQPGESYSYQTERNGNTYENTCMTHMGFSSVDIIYTKGRQKEQPAQDQEQTAPAAPAPAPAQAVAQQASGFDIGNLDLSGLDDMDMGV